MLFIKEKREILSLSRTLKLACSMDLVNPKVLVGKSNYDELVYLFSFLENKEEKIVDYSKNLVMNKKDYFELFSLSLFNELDKYDLYRIYHFMNNSDCFEFENLLLLFSKEILQDLGRNYPYLTDKYGKDGMNMRNYTIFSDSLFMNVPYDNLNQPFYETRENIDDFTLNPAKENENICYDEEKMQYVYFDEEFGGLVFRLFSDFVVEEEEKILLSKNRYCGCHGNAVCYTCELFDFPKVYVTTLVSGKVKRNEIDYYYHSWVEIQMKNEVLVVDYNHNIVMKKEDYYKLYQVGVISKTNYPELQENINFMLQIWDSHYYPCQFNYFGSDFTRDLKRNLHLFKKSAE